jgi:hypothetical protein
MPGLGIQGCTKLASSVRARRTGCIINLAGARPLFFVVTMNAQAKLLLMLAHAEQRPTDYNGVLTWCQATGLQVCIRCCASCRLT